MIVSKLGTPSNQAGLLMMGNICTHFADVCRGMGISVATFYIWKKKYGGLSASEVRRLRQLKDENVRLKRLVADLTLDKNILQEVIRKKFKAGTPPGNSPLDQRHVPSRC